jgi:hypothetical protein
VLWTVVAKYRKRDVQHLTEQKPLNRSIQKIKQFITSAGPPSRQTFIMIGQGFSAPHIGETYGLRSFFFLVTCWANAQPTPSARRPHIIHQSTRFRPWMCHLGVSSILLIPWGSYPRKTPHFGAPNGDSQLERLRAYLGTG